MKLPTDPAIHVTYQLQYRKCGKPHCRCKDAPIHGPYWYGYWREGGKVHAAYIGKIAPVEATMQQSSPRRALGQQRRRAREHAEREATR